MNSTYQQNSEYEWPDDAEIEDSYHNEYENENSYDY